MPTQKSEYASEERFSPEIIREQVRNLPLDKSQLDIFNATSEILMILNEHRQIVFINKNIIKLINLNIDEIYGMRPGELFNCIHSFKTKGGCGTTEFCRTCGAINSILESQNGNQSNQECRIIQKDTGNAFDLKVKATPIQLSGNEYTVFSVVDISDEKRRKILERIFFHDILNTAGAIRALSELLSEATDDEVEKFREMINSGSEKLIEEISMQRDLTAAENSELSLNVQAFNTKIFLKNMNKLYQNHEVCSDIKLILDENLFDTEIKTDKTILSRIIGNMLKNALEATPIHETVLFGCMSSNGKITFWVHNPSYIPRKVQLQIFNRSYSTKGSNRGLGTYSMKLLSERYLKGEVSFVSNETEGTIFKATYPYELV